MVVEKRAPRKSILTDKKMPFCPGCGHTSSVRGIAKALEELELDARDVILVSDIGCSGLVDPLFATHTIHGLHGRAPALAMGISLALDDPSKKVIAIQGDGGSTIGLQHLLEAARRNANVTLVVLNNQLYGMTGGQISGLSTADFKESKNFDEGDVGHFDVCQLAHQAGAPYCARITYHKNYNEVLKRAFQTRGFSLVEISSLCTPYGINKMKSLEDMTEPELELRNERKPVRLVPQEKNSLFNKLPILMQEFDSQIENRYGLILAGSAGGGVQAAAKLLASAGILSGLSTTMKGEYPITIGTGFSVADVILSRQDINYTGLDSPDLLIILSEDGLTKVRNRIGKNSRLIIDSKLADKGLPNAEAFDFFRAAGKKGAALCALAYWLDKSKLLKKEALMAVASEARYSESLLKAIESVDTLE